jgi:mannose-6-phosphate isomerase-like protein (cupin superfamily)
MAHTLKEEIGSEVHTLDQFFSVEEGTGDAVVDGVCPIELRLVRVDNCARVRQVRSHDPP